MTDRTDAFAQTREYKFGNEVEHRVARIRKNQGVSVLPAHDYSRNGAPLWGDYICPDLLCARGGETWLEEAKGKDAPTWYRKGKRWEVGVNRKPYLDYKKLQIVTGLPVRLTALLSQVPLDDCTCYQRQCVCPAGPELFVTGMLDDLPAPRWVSAEKFGLLPLEAFDVLDISTGEG